MNDESVFPQIYNNIQLSRFGSNFIEQKVSFFLINNNLSIMSMTGRYGPCSRYRRVPHFAVRAMSLEKETTVTMLYNVLRQTKTNFRSCRLMTGAESGDLHVVDCDEVYPNIFIGDGSTAKNKAYLKKIGITHVLNTAEGNRFSMVDTNESFYRDMQFKYLGLPLLDLATTRISIHFNDTSNFIDDALINKGKVYVHCFMGMSRSSTCVIAYLMMKKGMTATEAIRTIRQKRDIHPNEGFMQQLADLDNYLRKSRETLSSQMQ